MSTKNNRKLIVAHTSTQFFNTFDINRFQLENLYNGMRLFGVFFYYVDTEAKHLANLIIGNCATIGLSKLSKGTPAYLYIGLVNVSDNVNLVDIEDLMSETEFVKLIRRVGLWGNFNKYSDFGNNREIFQQVFNILKNEMSMTREDVVQILLNAGYHGFTTGEQVGTIFLIDLSLITNVYWCEYTKSTDLDTVTLDKL